MIQAGVLSVQDEGTRDIMALVGFAPSGRVAISSAVFFPTVLWEQCVRSPKGHGKLSHTSLEICAFDQFEFLL